MIRIPAWRIAWFQPQLGQWRLAVYEDRSLANAREYAAYLVQHGYAARAFLVPCVTYSTGHGVEA